MSNGVTVEDFQLIASSPNTSDLLISNVIASSSISIFLFISTELTGSSADIVGLLFAISLLHSSTSIGSNDPEIRHHPLLWYEDRVMFKNISFLFHFGNEKLSKLICKRLFIAMLWERNFLSAT